MAAKKIVAKPFPVRVTEAADLNDWFASNRIAAHVEGTGNELLLRVMEGGTRRTTQHDSLEEIAAMYRPAPLAVAAPVSKAATVAPAAPSAPADPAPVAAASKPRAPRKPRVPKPALLAPAEPELTEPGADETPTAAEGQN